MKTIATIFAFAIVLGVGQVVSAEDTATSNTETEAMVKDRAIELRTRNAANANGNREVRGELRLNASSTANRLMGIGADIRFAASSTRADFAAKREAIRADMSLKAKARGEMYLKNIIDRLGNAITRLESFMVRAEEAIEKFADRGSDTTEAESLLAEAEVKVDAAVTKVEALATLKIEADASDTKVTTTAAAKVRAATQEAITAIREAHKSLVAVISSLNANVRADINAEVKTQ